MEKKVLIITYYWPPSGGSGVQRWLKFVKYLPSFGWTPYVFTPENPSFSLKDESLLRDVPEQAKVIHFPIWEPYDAFFKLSSAVGEKNKEIKPTELVSGKKQSLFQRISTWVRGNFFIPDPRVFWVKPSARYLQDFLREHKINTIITTGPPHSIHLIGYRLKKKDPSLTWFADFRDPWSEWGFLDSIKVGTFARARHRRLEAKVLTTADRVVTVTPSWVRMFENLSGKKVDLLTNGYDADDFVSIRYKKTERFVIRHIGLVNERCNPVPFMEALAELCLESEAFRQNTDIEFVGEVHAPFKQYVREHNVLASVTRFVSTIPHTKLLALYGETSLLLLILTGYKDPEGYLPGKLFEYMATGLPILGVGPSQGDASLIMREAHHGTMIDTGNKEGIKKALLENFERWKRSGAPIVNPAGVERFSRKAVTQELVKLLSEKVRRTKYE